MEDAVYIYGQLCSTFDGRVAHPQGAVAGRKLFCVCLNVMYDILFENLPHGRQSQRLVTL